MPNIRANSQTRKSPQLVGKGGAPVSDTNTTRSDGPNPGSVRKRSWCRTARRHRHPGDGEPGPVGAQLGVGGDLVGLGGVARRARCLHLRPGRDQRRGARARCRRGSSRGRPCAERAGTRRGRRCAAGRSSPARCRGRSRPRSSRRRRRPRPRPAPTARPRSARSGRPRRRGCRRASAPGRAGSGVAASRKSRSSRSAGRSASRRRSRDRPGSGSGSGVSVAGRRSSAALHGEQRSGRGRARWGRRRTRPPRRDP